MITPRYIIGFTGHRCGIDQDAVTSGVTEALKRMQHRAVQMGGQVELFGSIAAGSDVLCVETARAMDVPVHLILPLAEEEFWNDFPTEAELARSQGQLDICRQRPQRDSVRLAPGEATRPECYFNAGMIMLQSCDVLIAIHDNQPSRGIGGTGDVVAHAAAMGIPVVIIEPVSGAVHWDDQVEAVIAQDPRIETLKQLAENASLGRATGISDPASLQACLDHIAVAEAARFRPSKVRIIMLQGIATGLAAMATYAFILPIKPVLAGIELLLVCMALWMTTHLTRRQSRDRWVDARFACELLRGLRASLPLLDALDPLIARHQSQWRRFALSAGLYVQNHAQAFDPFELRDRYLKDRLGESTEQSQIHHFERRSHSALRLWKASSSFGDWTARLAPVFVLVSLVNKMCRLRMDGAMPVPPDPFALWFAASFLPITLPLAAGVAGGLRQALDADRRVHRYPEMVTRLRLMRQWLSGLQTPSSICAAVSRCEGLLLDELEEWRMVAQNSGVH